MASSLGFQVFSSGFQVPESTFSKRQCFRIPFWDNSGLSIAAETSSPESCYFLRQASLVLLRGSVFFSALGTEHDFMDKIEFLQVPTEFCHFADFGTSKATQNSQVFVEK